MKKLILDKKACQDIIKDFSEKLTKAITDGQKTNGEFIFKYNLSSKLTEHKKLYITPTAWIRKSLKSGCCQWMKRHTKIFVSTDTVM